MVQHELSNSRPLNMCLLKLLKTEKITLKNNIFNKCHSFAGGEEGSRRFGKVHTFIFFNNSLKRLKIAKVWHLPNMGGVGEESVKSKSLHRFFSCQPLNMQIFNLWRFFGPRLIVFIFFPTAYFLTFSF